MQPTHGPGSGSELPTQDNFIIKDTSSDHGKSFSSKVVITATPSSPSSNAGGLSSPGEGGGGSSRQPSFRSRTDSLIEYTPPVVGEAAGSTFYINKAGHIDYVILLKVRMPFYLLS